MARSKCAGCENPDVAVAETRRVPWDAEHPGPLAARRNTTDHAETRPRPPIHAYAPARRVVSTRRPCVRHRFAIACIASANEIFFKETNNTALGRSELHRTVVYYPPENQMYKQPRLLTKIVAPALRPKTQRVQAKGSSVKGRYALSVGLPLRH